MSKSKKAIKTLNRHLDELDAVTDVLQGNNWKASLKDTLNLYIGPDSSISSRVDELFFTRKESYVPQGKGVIGILERHVYDDSNKINFKNLITNAIKHIESNGVYVNPLRHNFLAGFNNGQIISGLVIAAGIIYGAGNYLGKFEKEREIINLDKTIELKDKQIKELEDGENAELKTLKIENKNLWDTYHKLYDENEILKKENERLKKKK